ncbi:hypothetical protein CEXT_69631 [Caerostris extrusa]|uniref:Uncharacterized protein n=1 Tax=Caerostris extrusa TaxID=172846 RepID=A0AAV4TG28_CAEEX|nr:hypothetical protein CEXT_69631 [Caerostris extrusa]
MSHHRRIKGGLLDFIGSFFPANPVHRLEYENTEVSERYWKDFFSDFIFVLRCDWKNSSSLVRCFLMLLFEGERVIGALPLGFFIFRVSGTNGLAIVLGGK